MRAHGLPLLCLVSEAGRSSLRAKQLLARSSLHARRHAASPPPVCQAAIARSEGSSGRLRPTTPLLPASIAAPAASPAPPAPDAQAGLQPPRSRPRAEGVPFLRLRGAGRAGARPTRRAARGIPASASPSAEAPPRPRARAAGSGPARGGRTAARGAGAAHNPARAPPSSQSAARRGRAPPSITPSPSPRPPAPPSRALRGRAGVRSCAAAPGWVQRTSERLGDSQLPCHTSRDERAEKLGVRRGTAKRATTALATRGYVAHLLVE